MKKINIRNLRTFYFIFLLPISLLPVMILFNLEIFSSKSNIFCIWWTWGVVILYNTIVYTIVSKKNPAFVEHQKNIYIHLVFNILNSNFCFIYLLDINILTSVLYLILLISFMLCYNSLTKSISESFLYIMFSNPVKFGAFVMSICVTKFYFFHGLIPNTSSLGYIYQQYMIYLFYLEPFTVIFVFILLWYTHNWYRILDSFLDDRKSMVFRKFLRDIKYNYSANMLLDIFGLILMSFISHTLTSII